MRKKKLIAANWKMNPRTMRGAKELFLGYKDKASRMQKVDTVICPPALFLPELLKLYLGKKIQFGAQNAFYEKTGSYTGEVSAAQLKSLGVSYVILGHSERRALGEQNDFINKKVHAALSEKLTPILCVGEDERDENGNYLEALRAEITEGLAGLSEKEVSRIVLAYEPRWAIGKSADEAMKADDVYSTVLFIQKVLIETYGEDTAKKAVILYGGSAEPANAATLVYGGKVDGLLVGHASLEAESFIEMLEAVEKGGKKK